MSTFNNVIAQMAPTGILQLAKSVYLLTGVNGVGELGDIIILYDDAEWGPTISMIAPHGTSEQSLRYFILRHCHYEYTLCTYVCMAWLEMEPFKKEWWFQNPIVFRGEQFQSQLPLLIDIFGSVMHQEREFLSRQGEEPGESSLVSSTIW